VQPAKQQQHLPPLHHRPHPADSQLPRQSILHQAPNKHPPEIQAPEIQTAQTTMKQSV